MSDLPFSLRNKTSNTDEWYTPREAVEIIEPFLRANGFKKILCPFDKAKSEFVKVLSEGGYKVTYSHIEDGTDFFTRNDLKEFDAIVSNPPFSKKEEILKRLFDQAVPFAMLMCFNGIFDSKKKWELFKGNDFELLVPCGRIRFFNESCDGRFPNFQSVYVCNKVLDRQIVFEGTVMKKKRGLGED